MNGAHLSKRLQTVAGHVPQGARLADIGSDHAYLPVYLANNNQIQIAVAGEVARGPYDNATQEIKQAGLTHMIKSRLADGLLAIEPEDDINTVVIAGMGGTLIENILSRGASRLRHQERLILQPNVGEYKVRRWLQANRYQIAAEDILEEDGHIYEIIVADPVAEPVAYSSQELRFGPSLLTNPPTVFTKKWQAEANRLKAVLQTMKAAKTVPMAKVQIFEQELADIEEVIK